MLDETAAKPGAPLTYCVSASVAPSHSSCLNAGVASMTLLGLMYRYPLRSVASATAVMSCVVSSVLHCLCSMPALPVGACASTRLPNLPPVPSRSRISAPSSVLAAPPPMIVMP